MNAKKKVSSIESSFAMEGLSFDNDCRKRVEDVIDGKISITVVLNELRKKYRKEKEKKL